MILLSAVRGYLPVNAELRRNLVDFSVEQEAVRELSQKKSSLLLELRNYEENQKVASKQNLQAVTQHSLGVIPAQTQLSTALAINLGTDGKPVW